MNDRLAVSRAGIAPIPTDVWNTASFPNAAIESGAAWRMPAARRVAAALGCGTGKDFDAGKLRYGKICLLMDADSDGHHICTLLLTFFYRQLPELIRTGHVFIAQPPLYKVELGKEVHWALSDEERDRLLAKANGKTTTVQRFKGLGEMNPETLKQTTLDPKNRTLLRVDVADARKTEATIQTLMGKEVEPRFRFIMDRAPKVEEIDV